jgi:hypothetical protein
MASSATNIGSKYGSSLDTFTKDLKSGVDAVFLKWAEDSILIMRKIITTKARTKQASTLASTMYPIVKPLGVEIKGEYYWEFVDEGVKGVFNQSKAPNSKFSFKNLGVPPDMLKSFKDYIARTGSKGLRKQTLIRKNKKKQADLIEKEAMAMAVATKIGGIKPMNFYEPALGAKRLKVLNKALSKEMAVKIKLAIIK